VSAPPASTPNRWPSVFDEERRRYGVVETSGFDFGAPQHERDVLIGFDRLAGRRADQDR
jgi:hypothetical protein